MNKRGMLLLIILVLVFSFRLVNILILKLDMILNHFMILLMLWI